MSPTATAQGMMEFGSSLVTSSSTPPDSPLNKIELQQNSNVTLIRTTQIDSFFLWSYVYPGSTVYLWNHVSKKIMSSYNCLKAFDELNFKMPRNIYSELQFLMQACRILNLHLNLL
jgi:hypothetical protein